MKRIIPLTLAAVLAFGAPAAMAQSAVTPAQISSIESSLSAENVASAYTELSKMINATTDEALLKLLAAALTKVAEVAQKAGATPVQLAANANATKALAKASGTAVGQVPTEVAGQDTSAS